MKVRFGVVESAGPGWAYISIDDETVYVTVLSEAELQLDLTVPVLQDGRRLVAVAREVVSATFWVMLAAWDLNGVPASTITVGDATWTLKNGTINIGAGGAAMWFCEYPDGVPGVPDTAAGWGGANVQGGMWTNALPALVSDIPATLSTGAVTAVRSSVIRNLPPIYGDYGAAILCAMATAPPSWMDIYNPQPANEIMAYYVISSAGKGFAALAPYYFGTHTLPAGDKYILRFPVNYTIP